MERVTVEGMFLRCGSDKFSVRGVSYGPFRTNVDGDPLPGRGALERDLVSIRDLGANTLRLYHVPPPWVCEQARHTGLRLLVGVPWAQHIRFLDSSRDQREIRQRMRDAARSLRGFPNVLGILVGNEISPQLVRWYGAQRVERFLETLIAEAKEAAPEVLVSYGNYPMTEYLELATADFVSFNVYLHDDAAFRRYVARLQNLADFRPLLLSEFGIDSMREGEDAQAQILSRSYRAAAEAGCAGTVVFSYTDEWHTGGFDIEDWAFGLVTRERAPKASFEPMRDAFSQAVPPLPNESPKVSVVICAYNAERTMEECLESLRHLRYPDYEVIVVDDGSTDATKQIAERFPEWKLISRENRGLGVSRNDGILAASGEIVAFTDSDCAVDPDWLTYLVHRLATGEFAAVGGPNLPPPEDHWLPECIARAPGGPTHILLSDHEAEHIPGCNMAFFRQTLLDVGMFDPLYRAAGDDVDICWRLQNAGHKVGFAPAALVWHRRRNTVGAYLQQQRGYGHAESMLYFEHPFRFNRLGHSRWLGRIYGELGRGVLTSNRPIIYAGPLGSAFFQTLYEPPASLLRYLPSTLEWNAVAAFLAMTGVVSTLVEKPVESFLFVGIAMFAVSVLQAFVNASAIDLEGLPRGRARLMVAFLHYAGPLVRSVERTVYRIRQLSEVESSRFPRVDQKIDFDWRARRVTSAFWTEAGITKDQCVRALVDFLRPRKYATTVDNGWNSWDLMVHRGTWVRSAVNVLVEEHGGTKHQVDVGIGTQATTLAKFVVGSLVLGTVAAAATGIYQASLLFGAASVAMASFLAWNGYSLARAIYRGSQIGFSALGLEPMK